MSKGIACPKCEGRGWLPPPSPSEFPPLCTFCRGSGRLRVGVLSKLLGVPRFDLWAVESMTGPASLRRDHARLGPQRCARLLAALARVFPLSLGLEPRAPRPARRLPA